MSIESTFSQSTVSDLIARFKDKRINLSPGFQRKSVWTKSDRILLMKSIFSGYPVPSIFLYERSHNGRTIYDVIDGKQRLETIFMFTQLGEFKKNRFSIKQDFDGNGIELCDWPTICKKHPDVSAQFEKYKIQTVEVKGDLPEIIALFVRINSTGKALTSGEKRHAKYLDSSILKESERIVRQFKPYFISERILSATQIERMKGTELIAELLTSVQNGGPINKKKALDRAISNEHVNAHTFGKMKREVISAIKSTKVIFPNLGQTRFRNSAEFYSLCLAVWEMKSEGLVLVDKKRNAIALQMLRKLSLGVDQLQVQMRTMKTVEPNQQLYSEYLQTVQGSTDTISNRERRRAIFKSMFWSLYERKDENRNFTAEQRRIIWGTEGNKICARCKEPLSWSDFTADHILAFAKGGKTNTGNAQAMHKVCNSSKGAR